jgi:hypothetical protein
VVCYLSTQRDLDLCYMFLDLSIFNERSMRLMEIMMNMMRNSKRASEPGRG